MNVFFYRTSDPREKVTKTLTLTLSLPNATVRSQDGISIMDPVITIATTNTALLTANYMFIPQFARYYFITSIKEIRNGLIEFKAHCDVLMTYGSQIRNLKATIARQENKFNLYLPDVAFKAYAYQKQQIKKFPNPLTGANNLVLVVAGGDNTSSSEQG